MTVAVLLFLLLCRLVLNVQALQWKNGSVGAPPGSICSEPCKLGESRKRTSQCCWICAPCKDDEFLKVLCCLQYRRMHRHTKKHAHALT